MEVRAQAKYIRMSPRKVRFVLDMVRGMNAEKALVQLHHTQKSAARPVFKLVESAVANAKNNNGMTTATLVIKEITANDGPTLGRWMPRAHGRATPIRKRTSHIRVTLEGPDPKVTSAKDKKTSKKETKEIEVTAEQAMSMKKKSKEVSHTGNKGAGGKPGAVSQKKQQVTRQKSS
ncbi:MAG: 50S ribosomal protein L22 [Candidatus Jacksonbacteria bacterium]|jgi:large subunit ribosomal protein L22|nr:50S ribosomal protein L22 [Candidatus Jacksonbacteria bacterium]MBT6034074.1 50S ribosomal protein L22 [Candidatus Jacksonbacteria bacterium]MBT6301230.1 50S ribosomal protein L22 [Candidatus Jacksonbacteria bacterium]MBT6757308.1 50S ribosomal protein L22 [Candidatus Jacksonbacteria bacterium]MBT6955611.1 50S ribosomal protein L22 [Candidatus Jacksonbacteria bacterium]